MMGYTTPDPTYRPVFGGELADLDPECQERLRKLMADSRLAECGKVGWMHKAEWYESQEAGLKAILARIVGLIDEAEQDAEQSIEVPRTVLVDRILEAIKPYPLEKLENKK